MAWFGDAVGSVYALEVFTGKLVWKIKADRHPAATITATPALHEGTLYVPISSFEEAAAFNPGYVCCGFRGSLVALDAMSGKEKWRTWLVDEPKPNGTNKAGAPQMGPSGVPVWNSPAIDATRDQLTIGTGDNYSTPATELSDSVLALDLATGRIKWRFTETARDAWNAACTMKDLSKNCPDEDGPDFDIGAGTVLAKDRAGRACCSPGSKSGVAFGLDPDSGKLLWQTRLGHGGVVGGINFGMAASNGRVYVPVSDAPDNKVYEHPAGQGLYALDLASGAKLWGEPVGNQTCAGRKDCNPGFGGSIVATPDLVFAGADDAHLRIYDAASGKVSVGSRYLPRLRDGQPRGGARRIDRRGRGADRLQGNADRFVGLWLCQQDARQRAAGVRGQIEGVEMLKAIVVGTGFGCRIQTPALRGAGFDVVGLVGSNPERTAERAKVNGIAGAFTDLGAAIDATGADVVAISTTPHTHGALSMQALAKGCHVLCEKPFARDAAEARTLLHAAEAAGKVHMLGHEFRYMPDRATAARALSEGIIGEMRAISFVQLLPHIPHNEQLMPEWWFDESEGGGWLGASMPHLADQLRMSAGEMTSLSASLGRVTATRGTADDTFSLRFAMASGAEGVIQYCAGVFGPTMDLAHFAGSKGSLWIDGGKVMFADNSGTREIPVPDDLKLPPPPPITADPRHETPRWKMLVSVELAPYTMLCRALRAKMLGEPAPSPVLNPPLSPTASPRWKSSTPRAPRRRGAERSSRFERNRSSNHGPFTGTADPDRPHGDHGLPHPLLPRRRPARPGADPVVLPSRCRGRSRRIRRLAGGILRLGDRPAPARPDPDAALHHQPQLRNRRRGGPHRNLLPVQRAQSRREHVDRRRALHRPAGEARRRSGRSPTAIAWSNGRARSMPGRSPMPTFPMSTPRAFPGAGEAIRRTCGRWSTSGRRGSRQL